MTIAVNEIAPTFLRVSATARNKSLETSVRLFAETSSFILSGASGEIGWQYIGTHDSPVGVLIAPQNARVWEAVVPISRHFESLGPDFPGFVPLHSGRHTIQFVGDLDWQLPATGAYSLQQRGSLLADGFSPTVASNVIHFRVA